MAAEKFAATSTAQNIPSIGPPIVRAAAHMTPSEYRDLLAALGLTQAGAARLLGVSGDEARRWASDKKRGRRISRPAERFLRFLLAANIPPERALDILNNTTIAGVAREGTKKPRR